jgi:L-aminopeptidase/D-esterase-like protein
VSALAVVNSVGDVLAPDGTVLAGSGASRKVERRPARKDFNTVLAVVTTVANLDKRWVRWLASRGNDGITIAVRPAHTRYDGDVVFAVAAPDERSSGPAPDEDLDVLGRLATEAVAEAVRDAVDAART